MNRIEICFSEEDRKLLDMLFYRLGVLIERLPGPEASAPAAEHPADAPTAHLEPPAPASDPVAEAPVPAPILLAEFQKALVTRCAESPEVKQKVQDLVRKYADSVSAIPEDKRQEVLTALADI